MTWKSKQYKQKVCKISDFVDFEESEERQTFIWESEIKFDKSKI